MLLGIDIQSVTIGDAFKYVIVTIALLITICEVYNKLHNIYIKQHKKTSEKEENDEMLIKHDGDINDIKDCIARLELALQENSTQFSEVNKIQTRHFIVNSCNVALDRGWISDIELQSLEDLYEMYTKILNGNSYASTMMGKVRNLPLKELK